MTTTNLHIASNDGVDVAPRSSTRIRRQFIYMSVLFSSNHGCVVACLSLATARLGSIGAWQSGLLYFTYAISGLIGSTYIVKELGSRNALVCGMALYCVYVGAFGIATLADPTWTAIVAACGAILGGVGAGFLWTAQGSYFAAASAEYQLALRREESEQQESSQLLAGNFAFLYLLLEVVLRAMSTFLKNTTKTSWSTIFGAYSAIAVVSTLGMIVVESPRPISTVEETNNVSVWYKATAAWQVLVKDPKMKYMIGLNAVFGWTSAFLTSYVNGQVVYQVFGSDSNVGILSAWVSCVAAASSLVIGKLPGRYRGLILCSGACCFAAVALQFMIFRSEINVFVLILAYTCHGLGRSTFESTLRSTFADFFSDAEGAFANIILQNGLTSAVGFVLTFQLQCSSSSPYCVEYRDGSHHDVLIFELLILITAILAIFGYGRARKLRHREAYEPLVSSSSVNEEEETGGYAFLESDAGNSGESEIQRNTDCSSKDA